jgi:hypothetical protein
VRRERGCLGIRLPRQRRQLGGEGRRTDDERLRDCPVHTSGDASAIAAVTWSCAVRRVVARDARSDAAAVMPPTSPRPGSAASTLTADSARVRRRGARRRPPRGRRPRHPLPPAGCRRATRCSLTCASASATPVSPRTPLPSSGSSQVTEVAAVRTCAATALTALRLITTSATVRPYAVLSARASPSVDVPGLAT